LPDVGTGHDLSLHQATYNFIQHNLLKLIDGDNEISFQTDRVSVQDIINNLEGLV